VAAAAGRPVAAHQPARLRGAAAGADVVGAGAEGGGGVARGGPPTQVLRPDVSSCPGPYLFGDSAHSSNTTCVAGHAQLACKCTLMHQCCATTVHRLLFALSSSKEVLPADRNLRVHKPPLLSVVQRM